MLELCLVLSPQLNVLEVQLEPLPQVSPLAIDALNAEICEESPLTKCSSVVLAQVPPLVRMDHDSSPSVSSF